MVGIVSYGFYVPQNRIKTEEIAAQWGKNPDQIKKGLRIHEKAVAGRDEDVLTMAYEASVKAFANTDMKPSRMGAVLVGSENHPYVVNPTSTTLAEYLDVGNDYLAFDTEFACKGATGALMATFGFVKSGMADAALVVGSDKATGKPGDALEYSAGSAAVSLIVGTENTMLNFIDGTSFSSDTPDFWRRDGNMFPSHAGRFTGEPAYFKHVIGATKAILKKTGTEPGDYDHAIFHMPNGKFPARVSKMLGFSNKQIKHSLVVEQLGNSYSASALMGLCGVLEYAKAGEKILLVSYGSGAGSDAFVFEVTAEIEKKRYALLEAMQKKNYVNYVDYMKLMNML